MDCLKCIMHEPFYSRNGIISCKLRHAAFCGESGKRLAERQKVTVNNTSEDPCRFGTGWPHKFSQEDLIACPHYREK